MATSFSGGCACGAIRYECSADPIMSANCHCRDCQRESGGAFAAVVVVPKAAFKITKGEPKHYDVKTYSGSTISRGFCPECGSPLFAKPGSIPDVVGIRAGSLDDPSWFKPAMDIYTASAQPWDHMNPELSKSTGMLQM